MALVAVNKDGSEYIYNHKPIRDYEFEDFSCDDSICMAFWIYLPQGSIKKLIGRELTWNDEPVELE